MKYYLHILILLSSFMFFSSTSFAGDKRCETSASYFKKITKIIKKVCNYNKDLKAVCNGTLKKSVDLKKQEADIFIKVWNDIADNNWSKIGPRHFSLGSGDNGTIVSPGQRAWISRNTSENSVTISVDELDGKLEAKFHVCVFDSNGVVSYKAGKTFKSKKKKEKHSVTVDGVKGKFVMFKLATAKVSVGKKLKYKFSSTTK